MKRRWFSEIYATNFLFVADPFRAYFLFVADRFVHIFRSSIEILIELRVIWVIVRFTTTSSDE